MNAVRKYLPVLALLALTTAIYWPALRGEFVWDDLLLVKKNPLVTGEFTVWSLWFRTDFPLSILSFWLQSRLWGDHAAGFHAVNLALHLANTFLLWRVLSRAKIPGAGFAAALFAAHPLCVASVAWVSELKNVLSLTFLLLSASWYLRNEVRSPAFRRSGDDPPAAPPEGGTPNECPRRMWYWLALVAFALALLAKTSAVALPVFLLALAWWQNGKISPRDVLRTAPFFALAIGFGLMTVWFQQHQLRLTENLEPQNFASRIAIAGMALWFYLGKILAPLNLCAIYPRWQPDAAALVSFLPAVAWCAALAASWWFRKRCGIALLIALGCFTAALFPVLGFFNFYFSALSRVSDHFAYLPLVCIVVLAAATLKRFLPGIAFRAVATAIVLALALLASQRARVYATDEALWRDTLAKNSAAWTAHNNLGCIRAEQHRNDEAITLFEDSLKLNPRNASAHLNLARLLAMRRAFAPAETHFLAAIELKPDDPEARNAFAAALADAGRIEAAIAQLELSLRAKLTLEAHMQLAGLYRAAGKIREAIAQSRAALKLQPDQPEVLSNLAWLLATSADDSLRNGKDAVRFAERACQLTKFAQAPMVGTLAAAYAEAGHFDAAASTAQKAIALATEAGDLQFANVNRQLLQLYQSRQPFHETPPKR